MNTIELTRVLEKVVKHRNICLLGVLASDQLPRIIVTTPTMAIINTQPSTMPGAHWLAVYIDEARTGYFFDSFGHSPAYIGFPDDIYRFLKLNCLNVQYSKRQVQENMATTCGQHCVYFLCQIQKRLSYQEVMNMYHDRLHCNDIMVCKFVSRIRPGTCRSHEFTCVQCVHP